MKHILLLFISFFFLLNASAQSSGPVSNNISTDEQLQILYARGDSLFKVDRFREALEVLTQQHKILKQAGKEQDSMYVDTYIGMASCFSRLNEIDSAVIYCKKGTELEAALRGEASQRYAFMVDNLGCYYAAGKQWQLSYESSRKALTIYEKLLLNDEDLAAILIHLAEASYETQRLDEAVKYQLRALPIVKELDGEHSEKYIDELTYLAKYYHAQGKSKKVQELEARVQRLRQEVENDPTLRYAEMFSTAEKCHRMNDLILVLCKRMLDEDISSDDIREITQFIFLWSINSADVNITVGKFAAALMPKGKTDNIYLGAYLAACIVDQLENGKSPEADELPVNAIIHLTQFYIRRNEEFGSNQILDVCMSAYQQNKLEEVLKNIKL